MTGLKESNLSQSRHNVTRQDDSNGAASAAPSHLKGNHMDEIKTCPLLGGGCLQLSCAWFVGDGCAMQSAAVAMEAIDHKLLCALDVLDGLCGDTVTVGAFSETRHA